MRIILGILGVACVSCMLFYGGYAGADELPNELAPSDGVVSGDATPVPSQGTSGDAIVTTGDVADDGVVSVDATPDASQGTSVDAKGDGDQALNALDRSLSIANPTVATSDGSRAAVTLEDVNANVLATPGNVWNENIIYFNMQDIHGDYARFDINARQWLVSDTITQNGHSIYTMRGLANRTYDMANRIELNESAHYSSLVGTLDSMNRRLLEIQEDAQSGGLSSTQWNKLVDNLKTQNTLLLVACLLLSAVFGSSVAPMLVKGWRR